MWIEIDEHLINMTDVKQIIPPRQQHYNNKYTIKLTNSYYIDSSNGYSQPEGFLAEYEFNTIEEANDMFTKMKTKLAKQHLGSHKFLQ